MAVLWSWSEWHVKLSAALVCQAGAARSCLPSGSGDDLRPSLPTIPLRRGRRVSRAVPDRVSPLRSRPRCSSPIDSVAVRHMNLCRLVGDESGIRSRHPSVPRETNRRHPPRRSRTAATVAVPCRAPRRPIQSTAARIRRPGVKEARGLLTAGLDLQPRSRRFNSRTARSAQHVRRPKPGKHASFLDRPRFRRSHALRRLSPSDGPGRWQAGAKTIAAFGWRAPV